MGGYVEPEGGRKRLLWRVMLDVIIVPTPTGVPMTRAAFLPIWCLLLTFAVALSASPAAAAPPEGADPVSAQLAEARQRYEKATAAADAAALKAFERPINAALDRGDIEASRRLEGARARL